MEIRCSTEDWCPYCFINTLRGIQNEVSNLNLNPDPHVNKISRTSRSLKLVSRFFMLRSYIKAVVFKYTNNYSDDSQPITHLTMLQACQIAVKFEEVVISKQFFKMGTRCEIYGDRQRTLVRKLRLCNYSILFCNYKYTVWLQSTICTLLQHTFYLNYQKLW